MDWGFVHGWINSIMLGMVALIMIVFRRWSHLRWLAGYALVVSFLSILYKLVPQFYGNYDFYVTKRFIGYLLFLGAAAEILRKDFDITPWWIIPAILAIFIPAVLFPPYGWFFYLPRIILFIGVASTLYRAVKGRNVPLLALAIGSVGDIVSDALKLISTLYQITMVQILIDPWCSTVMSAILITGALWQEIINILRSIVVKHDIWRLHFKEGLTSTVENEPSDDSLHSIAENEVIPFPDEYARSVAIKAFNSKDFAEDIESAVGRLTDLEDVLQAAAILVSLSNKTFLSLREVAIYLGTTDDVALKYVEENNIKKIYLSNNSDHWLVVRSDVDENIKNKAKSPENKNNQV